MDRSEAIASEGIGAHLEALGLHLDRDRFGDEETSEVSLGQTMIELLQGAQKTATIDQRRSRDLIVQVIEMLRVSIDRCEPPNAISPGGLAPWQVRALKVYIEKNLARPITTEDLARTVNLSRSYFSRAFKKSFRKTPHLYLTVRRTLRAQEMMLTTTEPLSEIAVACGLVDQSHLCKLFRRTVGRNPQSWRRTFRKGSN